MIVLGIDPGITGAVAVYDVPTLRVVAVHDLPITAKAIGRGQQLNAAELSRLVRRTHADHAVVEAQRPMPKQGVTSTFSLGRSAGVIEGVLAALEVPLSYVEPRAWKAGAGLKLAADKQASVTRAVQLFPGLSGELTRKRDHGRAEAMLIAWFGVTRLLRVAT